MSNEDEIEDLEDRLLMYKGVTGGHPARTSLLSEKIKSMEKQLDILKRAEAFDEIIEEYDGIMKEVRNRKFKHATLLGLRVEKVIKKYESGDSHD